MKLLGNVLVALLFLVLLLLLVVSMSNVGPAELTVWLVLCLVVCAVVTIRTLRGRRR